jgi:voltage-gated potassium channel Kch
VCRTGSPIDLGDLRLASPRDARSIIVLSPDAAEPDSHVIKTILALTHAPDRRSRPYHIVAEIRDASNLDVAGMVGGDEAVLVDRSDMISRLIVQASRQAGASVVYTDLLGFEGDEIYFREDPSLAGRTFHDVLLAYEDCAIIGIRRGPDGVLLNPAGDVVVRPGDEVIAIAEDDSVLAVAKPCVATVDSAAIELRRPLAPAPQRSLVLGYNRRTPAVISQLDDFAYPGSSVSVVAEAAGAEAAMHERSGRLRTIALQYRRGDVTDRTTLETLVGEGYDDVIVMSSDELDVQEADARTLVTLLHLRDIGRRLGRRLSIVSEMLDDRNRALAAVTQVDDVIVSEQVISLMLAQLAENVHLHAVFTELLQAEGSEIYLRPVEDYVWPNTEVNFATLVAAAARRSEAAIGYRRAAQADDPAATYGVTLNPLKSARFTAEPGDRLIVLAED